MQKQESSKKCGEWEKRSKFFFFAPSIQIYIYFNRTVRYTQNEFCMLDFFCCFSFFFELVEYVLFCVFVVFRYITFWACQPKSLSFSFRWFPFFIWVFLYNTMMVFHQRCFSLSWKFVCCFFPYIIPLFTLLAFTQYLLNVIKLDILFYMNWWTTLLAILIFFFIYFAFVYMDMRWSCFSLLFEWANLIDSLKDTKELLRRQSNDMFFQFTIILFELILYWIGWCWSTQTFLFSIPI